MSTTRRSFIKTAVAGTAGATTALAAQGGRGRNASGFRSALPTNVERVFVGPEFWANRLQDWRLKQGRIECVDKRPESPMRALHLLTHRLGNAAAAFTMRTRTGLLDEGAAAAADAATGFLLGAGGATMDYRAAALIHQQPGPGGGLFAGCDANGQVFFREFTTAAPRPQNARAIQNAPREITLELAGAPGGELTLTARDAAGRELSRARQSFPQDRLAGNVALVSHPGTGANAARFWFQDWQVSGDRVTAHPERVCGPILSALYTVHDRTLKLTAQMMPVGLQENRTAELQIKQGRGWRTVQTTEIDPAGWVAQFRVNNWNDSRAVPYRVRYQLKGAAGRAVAHTWDGAIAANPVNKDELVLASLSCVQQINGALTGNQTYRWNYNVNFPHADLTPNLKKQNPDLYFFAGDQIYEGNPTRIVRAPAEEAALDYLYKWYLWCWTFGDVVRHTPCICIPDDHDVYHGNVWGDGGRAAAQGDPAGLFGGYGMPANWVNLIQRTQTSHLPDPVDPAPVAQNISVYFTQLVWGEIGFAILEDRKFKSSPTIIKAEMTRDSHITQKDYDTRQIDSLGGQLLGDRQIRFLHAFSKDWRGQQMKACLSQTIFCNLQISSRPPTVGELDKDLDSNAWPQAGRAAALRELRRGFMIHLAGDQHLASALQHGIDEYGDACWSQCSPAIANVYTRYWNPNYPPLAGAPLAQPFSGNYEDGFHNKLTIHAVANPVEKPQSGEFPEPMELHRKATGYNIIRFNKTARTIRLETWSRYANPQTDRQYPGWPITIKQTDNYGRRAAAYLPTLKVTGMKNPVVQVIEEASGETLYTLRIPGTEFRPHVFAPGLHTIHVGELGTARSKSFTNLEARAEKDDAVLRIAL
ncbi:MAG: alkaline phosphatase D family protein [Blastocatellia bacterium]|nr:alkaline phosphatase D family protein [Blastocatellia bacterium]